MIRSQSGGLRIKFSPFFSQSGLDLLPTDARHVFIKRPFVARSLFSAGLLGALSACGVSTGGGGGGGGGPPPNTDPVIFPEEGASPPLRSDTVPERMKFDSRIVIADGQEGDDSLGGGFFDDKINGGPGSDRLMGGFGNDTLNGNEGDDEIDGGSGNDKINGGEGNDRLTGGTGNDTFTVSKGVDSITDFGMGVDVLNAAAFSANLGELAFTRGTGADNYYDIIFFSDADSTLILERVLSGEETVADWLLPFAATTSDFTDSFSGIALEYVIGTDTIAVNDQANTVTLNAPMVGNMGGKLFGFGGDDTLTGNAGDDYIFGGDGDDTIDGAGGDDVIHGGNGSDTINGGDGNDRLTGGASVDTFVVSQGSDTITDFRTDGSNSNRDLLDFTTLISMGAISNLRFSHIADSLDLQITFTLSGGDHTITLQDVFQENSFFIAARPLFEHYDAEAMTANILDVINEITAYSDIPDDDDTTSDDGKDASSFFKGLAVTYGSDTANHENNTITLAAGVEDILYGFGGDDELTGNDDKDNKIFGGDGEDTINGGGGADTLYGGDDSDTINGGADADTIYGGNGNDTIDGGDGNDNLYGGGSGDTFVVSTGSDTIHDFQTSDDLDFAPNFNDGTDTDTSTLTLADLTFAVNANDMEDLDIAFNDGTNNHTITIKDLLAEGDNRFAGDSLEDLIIALTADSDRYFIGLAETEYGTQTANDNVNTITLAAGVTDTLYGFGGSDKLTGNNEDNTIYGGDGSDDIDGKGGNDNLYGGSNSDDFFASEGSDTIHDFSSSDDLEFENFNDGTNTNISTLSLSDLVFTANANDADDLDVAFNDGTTDHTITIKDILDEDDSALLSSSLANSLHTVISRLTRGDILLDLADFELTDSDGNTHSFSSSADSFTLTSGVTDTIYGLQGSDELTGNDEGTTIYGGSGNDTIDGGGGDDILVGGTGVDTFVVSAGSDTIADFRASYGGSRNDIIDFSNATLTQLSFAFVNNDNDLQVTGFEVGGTASTLTLQNVFNRGYAFVSDTISQAIESITLNESRLDGYFDGITDTVMGDDEDSDESIDVTMMSMTHFALGGDDTITVTATSGTNGAAIYGGSGNDQITGGDGADFIHGGSASDTISGGSGADILYGGSGNDMITGGDGNDSLDGGSNNDELDGGAGNDTLGGGSGNDELDGGAGNDTLTGNDGNDTFFISTGTDLIIDFSTGDSLNFRSMPAMTISFALSGDDLVISNFAGAGDMLTLTDVFAEGGLFYNPSGGNMRMGAAFSLQHALDVLLHDNTILAGDSPDSITAAGGYAFGFGGNDILTGTAAAEQLYGGSGNDTITGNGGVDDLYGGSGDDELTGGAGNDTFHVSQGADTITDFNRAGTNNDILDFGYFRDSEGSVTIDISDLAISQSEDGDDVQITGFGGGNSLTFENILSASTASDGINSLQDFIDFLYGTRAGADAANLRLPDTVGTSGADTLTATASDRLYGFDGNDTLTAHVSGSYLYGGDGVDRLIGDDGNDNLFGGAGGDTIIGGAGNDAITGGGGNDVLTGDFIATSSDNRVYNDTFVISEGTDTITDFYFSESLGGERDILDFSNFGDALSQSLAFAQSGMDLQITGYGAAGDMLVLQNVFDTGGVFDGLNLQEALVRLNSGAFANLDGVGNGNLDITINGVRNIFGTGEDDTTRTEAVSGMPMTFTLTLNGDGQANVLYGGDGRDTLNGLAGNDTLYGGNHYDILNGGDDDDMLFGGGGGDDLDGGDGNDTLTGNDGDDYFQGSGGTDTITDFRLIDDNDVLDFSNTNGGVESASDLTASVSNGQFALSYDHDGNDGTLDAMFVFGGTEFAATNQGQADLLLQLLIGNSALRASNSGGQLAVSYDHDSDDSTPDAMLVFQGADFAVDEDSNTDTPTADELLQEILGSNDILAMSGSQLVFL